MDAFVALLLRWNERINLVAAGDAPDLWSRHVADSLQLAPFVPLGTSRAIDIGSGAGFPGLILAIATDIPWDLVESDQRKAAFLREAARITEAPVNVHPVRAQQAGLVPAPLVTARGFANLSNLLGVATQLVTQEGTCLFPKGESAARELTQARRKWQMSVEQVPSQMAGGGTILIVRHIRPAGDAS